MVISKKILENTCCHRQAKSVYLPVRKETGSGMGQYRSED